MHHSPLAPLGGGGGREAGGGGGGGGGGGRVGAPAPLIRRLRRHLLPASGAKALPPSAMLPRCSLRKTPARAAIRSTTTTAAAAAPATTARAPRGRRPRRSRWASSTPCTK